MELNVPQLKMRRFRGDDNKIAKLILSGKSTEGVDVVLTVIGEGADTMLRNAVREMMREEAQVLLQDVTAFEKSAAETLKVFKGNAHDLVSAIEHRLNAIPLRVSKAETSDEPAPDPVLGNPGILEEPPTS